MVCLVLPLSMTYAYNSASYDSGADRMDAIQPLPTLKVEKMGKELTKRYAAPELVFDAMPAAPAVGMQFSLNELNEEMAAIEESYQAAFMSFDPVDPAFIPYMRALGQGNYSAKAKKIKKIVDGAISAAPTIDALTGGDLVTMPLKKVQMIGQTEVSIIFNKARIYPQHTLLEVFIKVKMAQVDIEGNPVELFFAADDILFSQEEGIIGGTIGLVNDYAIKIGNSDKAAVWLQGMTKTKKTVLPNGATIPASTDEDDPFDDKYYDKWGTYVSFDCDGFKEMGIGGEVLFSREWVIPADEDGLPLTGTADPSPRVRASFGAVVQNMNDLFISIDMPHFLVSKYQDISLEIGGAYLDLSSHRNPPGIPEEYGIEPDLWEGVYIQNIGITLPQPFRRTCGSFTMPPDNPDAKPETCRIKIDAEHLLIDEYGLDGTFSVSGQAPLVGGPIMDGEWGWSMNTLSLQIENSELTAFGFAGGLGVPILDKDDPLEYTAAINLEDKSFVFDVESTGNDTKSFPIWNAAQVNIEQPIGVNITVLDGEFDASITLSGSLTIGDPKDKKEGEGGSFLKMPSITFTDLTFSTKSPKFTVGYFGLTNEGEQASIVNFPVVPSGLALSTPINSDEVNLDFGVVINLMKTDESAINASGAFTMKGKIERDLGGAQRWVYKDILFTGAQVVINVPQFYGKGSLKIFRGDKIYGSGFSAKLTVKVLGSNLDEPSSTGKFKLSMAAIFGSSPSSSGDLGEVDTQGGSSDELDNYRYWMADGLVQSDKISVPLMPPFELNGFGGGAFYHMKPYSYNEGGEDSDAVSQIGEATTGIVYRPNANTGTGIKFTASITSRGDLMSGLLTCIIRFSPTGGLQNVTFWGTVDILKDGGPSNRAKPDIEAGLDKNVMETDDIIAANEEDAQTLKKIEYNSGDESVSEPGKGIQGQLGISFDFDGGFSFHGYAKVTIRAKALEGVGTLDLLLDLSDDTGTGSSSSDKGDWHLYIGGYYENNTQQVLVPGFFNEEEEVVLEPVSVGVSYGGSAISAQVYFLTGTTIPGPPPAPAEVIAFFNEDPGVNSDNRDKMNCGGKGPAMGTGIAFGATAGFEFDIKKGGVFGKCPLGIEVQAYARVGFDLALLKYAADTKCSISGDKPHGLRGFRATGRAYAIVDLRGGHITCFKLPNVGIGVKVEFDVFKPSYLDIKLTVKAFGEKATLGFDIGDQCGIVCQ